MTMDGGLFEKLAHQVAGGVVGIDDDDAFPRDLHLADGRKAVELLAGCGSMVQTYLGARPGRQADASVTGNQCSTWRVSRNRSRVVAPITSPSQAPAAPIAAPAPRFQGSLSTDHDLVLPRGWTATVGGVLAYTGERRETFANDPAEIRPTLPSFTRLILRLSARRDLWLLSLYANNVTNARGALSLSFISAFAGLNLASICA